MLITSGKSDYDVKPLKQLKFFFGGGGQNAYSAPSIIILGGSCPRCPPLLASMTEDIKHKCVVYYQTYIIVL